MKHFVLIAHSDAKCRGNFQSILSDHGCEADVAADGLECLAKLRRVQPDLLILDVHLRWGGGDGVLDVMRADPELPAVPVVLTSATAFPEIEGLLSSPVVGSFGKPVPLPAILEAEATEAHDAPTARTGRQ